MEIPNGSTYDGTFNKVNIYDIGSSKQHGTWKTSLRLKADIQSLSLISKEKV